MATNREICRGALVADLTTILVGPTEIKSVVGSTPETFGADAPLVYVLSGGTERERWTFVHDKVTFLYDVYVVIPPPSPLGTWTNATAEDQLDLVEQLIGGMVEDNRRASEWDTLEYADRTHAVQIEMPKGSGIEYPVEVIPIRARLAGS